MKQYKDDDKLTDKKDDLFNGAENFNPEKLYHTAETVRFFRNVIRTVIFVIILIGAGCGFYLYNRIAPRSSREEPASDVKTRQGQAKTEAAQSNAPDENMSDDGDTVENNIDTTAAVETQAPDAQKQAAALNEQGIQTAAVAIKNSTALAVSTGKTAEALLKNASIKAPSTETVAVTHPGDTRAVAAAKTQPAATYEASINKTGTTAEIAAAVTKDTAETIIANNGAKATAEVKANAKPEPAVNFDITPINALTAAGSYDKAVPAIIEALKIKGLNQESSDRLNLCLSKIKFFAEANPAEAATAFLKVRTINASALQYAVLYLKLFHRQYPEKCRLLIDSVLSSVKVTLSDEEKIEIAKACLASSLLQETSRTLKNVIAASEHEKEIAAVNSSLKMAQEAAVLTLPGNPFSKTFLAPDTLGLFDKNKPAATHSSHFFSSPAVIRTLFFKPGNGAELSACTAKGSIYTISAATGKFERTSAPEGGPIDPLCVFNFYRSSNHALIKKGAIYGLSALADQIRTPFSAAYINSNKFNYPFLISPDEKYMVKMTPDEKVKNRCSFDIVELSGGKTTFKTSAALYFENTPDQNAFSADMKKNSVGTTFDSRFFYYFKSAEGSGAAETSEAAVRLRFFSLDLETSDEKPLFQIKTAKPENISVSYSGALEAIIVSFNGTLSLRGSEETGGTWIISRTGDAAIRISLERYSSFAALKTPTAAFIFALTSDRAAVKLIEVRKSDFKELLSYTEQLFKKDPEKALEILAGFNSRTGAGTGGDLLKAAAEYKLKSEIFEKIKIERTVMELKTLKRLELHKLLVVKAEAALAEYGKKWPAETAEIGELKNEIEKRGGNEKK